MKPIPFNLERAKAGDPILHEGRPAKFIGHFPFCHPNYRVYIHVDGARHLTSYTEDGRVTVESTEPVLTMAPKKRVVWVNMYNRPGDTCSYSSKETADNGAMRDRIACVRVEFEEGEGL